MMKNKIITILCVVLVLIFSAFPCFALSHSTYSDLAQNNSTVQNLLSYAMNYSSFAESDFVVYCSAQYTYYIVWGDLAASGNKVTSSEDINYIEYSRDSLNQYSYKVSSSSDFTLNINNVITSNIDGVGMRSQIYEDYEYRNTFVEFSIFFAVILFVILLFKVRKG